MSLKSIKFKISQLAFHLPTTVYLLFFAVCLWLAHQWLHKQTVFLEPSSYTDIIKLLVKVTTAFILTILVLSLVSVLVPYLLFLIAKKRGKVQVALSNQHVQNKKQQLQKINFKLSPILQPVFGFLRFRLYYDDAQLSDKFSIVKDNESKLFSWDKSGWYNWPLPSIKEYRVYKMTVYFEDFFQFFSLSITEKINQSFYTKPHDLNTQATPPNPKYANEDNVRIEELRRVDGEFLNYKKFEPNDDVRRIVWKIYAKNKELVVRTPEIFDPIAAEIYVYVSFYDSIGIDGLTVMQTRGLNYYKNVLWSVFKTIYAQQPQLHLIMDQPVSNEMLTDTVDKTEYNIAVSNWQTNTPLSHLINQQKLSVLCISSLSDINEVENVLSANGNVTVILAKLTNGMRRGWMTNWITWLFLQEEKDKDKLHTIQWRFSMKRGKIKQNETELEILCKKMADKVIMI